MHTLAVANQKGGVGKTTSAVVLASLLADEGFRVVLVDLDPQASSTKWLLGFQTEVEESIGGVLLAAAKGSTDRPLSGILTPTSVSGLRIAPSGGEDMDTIEPHLMNMVDREYALRTALEDLEETDVVLIDCPPSLGVLTLNGLTAAHAVIIPVEMNALSAAGLSDILQTIRTVRRRANPGLKIFGVLPVRVRNTRLAKSTIDGLMRGLEGVGRVLTAIPEAVAVQEAAQASVGLQVHAPTNVATMAYRTVAGELSSSFRKEAA